MSEMSMVVRLLGDGKSYAGAMEASSRATAKLNSDLDKLVVAMEAELAGETEATTQKKILELADKGASAAKTEYALALANEVESHRRVAAAVAEEARVKQQAAQREAEWMAQSADRWDRQVQKQIQSQRGATQSMGAQSKGTMVAIEATRGLEDAVAGYTNNGLKGMITATSNNIGQLGSLIGKTAGMSLMIGSVGALIAVSLVPKLMEWADGTAKIREETLKLNDVSQKYHDDEMRRIDERYKANFSRGRESRRNDKLLSGDASAKDLNSEAERLRERIEGESEIQIIERRKQTEIARSSPLSHLETNPYEKGKFHASPDEEIRKKQAERWETDRKALVASRNAQQEAARDQALHQQLLQKTEAAARERSKQERKQEIDEMIDKEREKNQKSHEQRTKQAADLADKEQKFQADMLAKGFALEAKAADALEAEKIRKLEGDQKTAKKILDGQTDQKGGQDLSAVEANSSDAFKRVYDATRGGGENNPARIVADNTAKMLAQMKIDAERAERELEAIKALRALKTGPA